MNLSKKTLDCLKRKYGNWALITGATSGIGREMAIQLAAGKFNLVITGRREKLLNDLSVDLFDRYGIEVVPVTGDLSNLEEVESLLNETEHLPIGIVILNAGYGTSGSFLTSELTSELNMLELNCKAVLIMAHHYTQSMKNESRRGAIVFLSSMVGFQGVPNAAHYAATKAYVQSLGEGLAVELKEEGIDVLTASPGPVNSGFATRANLEMGNAMKADSIAHEILSSIGLKSAVLPGRLTKFLVFNLRLVPRWAKVRIMEKVMGGFTKHQVT